MLGMDEQYKHECDTEDLLMLLAMLHQLEKQAEIDISQFDYEINEYVMRDPKDGPQDIGWDDMDKDTEERSRYAEFTYTKSTKIPAPTKAGHPQRDEEVRDMVTLTYYTTCFIMKMDLRHEERNSFGSNTTYRANYNLFQNRQLHLDIRKSFLKIFKAVQHYRRVTVPIQQRQAGLDAIAKCFPQVAVETLFLREHYVKEEDTKDGDDRGVSSQGRENPSDPSSGTT